MRYNESNGAVSVYEHTEYEETAEHSHNALELIMPDTHGLEIFCGGERFRVGENRIIIIPAGTLHSVKAARGSRTVIHIPAELLNENPALAELREMFTKPLVLGAEQIGAYSFGSLVGEIRGLSESGAPLSEALVYIKLLTLLVNIAELAAAPRDPSCCPDKLGLALKYVDRNYMNDITLDELANVAGYSRYHFSRLFRRFSGTTLKEYLNRRRVREAALLLTGTNLSITETAMKSGFSSLTTFNRVFRQLENCTPSEYKRRHGLPGKYPQKTP